MDVVVLATFPVSVNHRITKGSPKRGVRAPEGARTPLFGSSFNFRDLQSLYKKGVTIMGAQENKEFIRRYLEALSGKPKPPELVDQFVAEQPLKDHIAGGEQGFPGYSMDVDLMVAEDDLVSVIFRFGGTNTGSFMGIPATGKTVSGIPVHITYRVENGKIVEHWMLMDSAALMQQLGLVPSAA